MNYMKIHPFISEVYLVFSYAPCALLFSLSAMCAAGALLICFAANRWWVWCYPCLSGCNQSTEEKLSLFVTHDVPKVSSRINSITLLIDFGLIFCLSFSLFPPLCPGVKMHLSVEITILLFPWTIRGLKPLFIFFLFHGLPIFPLHMLFWIHSGACFYLGQNLSVSLFWILLLDLTEA